MNATSNKFSITLHHAEDGSGAYILLIPDAIRSELNWKDGDILTIEKMSEDVVLISNLAGGVEQLDEEVVALAEEVFGDSNRATNWLVREHRLLGMSPVAYLKSGKPKIEVLKILQSIMHGNAV